MKRKKLKVKLLNQNCPKSNPFGEDFAYKERFEALDIGQVKKRASRSHDFLKGLVACGFWPLWSSHCEACLAQRWNL